MSQANNNNNQMDFLLEMSCEFGVLDWKIIITIITNTKDNESESNKANQRAIHAKRSTTSTSRDKKQTHVNIPPLIPIRNLRSNLN